MEVICYVCNETAKDWRRNLVETKSKHSKTSIATFIKTFLKDNVSERNVDDESNCICSDCLSRIYAYDWMCINVKKQENELRQLLLKTEMSFMIPHIKSEFEFVNSMDLAHTDYNHDVKHELIEAVNNMDEIQGMEIDLATIIKTEIIDYNEDDAEQEGDTEHEDNAEHEGDAEYENDVSIDDDDDTDDDYLPNVRSGNKKLQPTNTVATIDPRICGTCGEKLKNPKAVESHAKIHTKSPGMLTCHVCLYEISDKEKDSFKNHVRKHTKETANQCVICSEGGIKGFNLKYHVQSQHNAPLSCNVCSKSFVYASALRVHLRSHIDHLPEQCNHCKKSFPDKESLELHEKIHVQAVCTFCGKNFTRKQKCKAHELRHTNQSKKFKCTLCPAACDTERGLKTHIARKHSDKKLDDGQSDDEQSDDEQSDDKQLDDEQLDDEE